MTAMKSSTPVSPLRPVAAAWLRTVTVASLGLHSGAGGTVCRCGQCRHRVIAAARAYRVPANVVAARVWKPGERKVAAPARRRPLTGSVAAIGTVVVGGRQMSGAEAIVAMSQRHAAGRKGVA